MLEKKESMVHWYIPFRLHWSPFASKKSLQVMGHASLNEIFCRPLPLRYCLNTPTQKASFSDGLLSSHWQPAFNLNAYRSQMSRSRSSLPMSTIKHVNVIVNFKIVWNSYIYYFLRKGKILDTYVVNADLIFAFIRTTISVILATPFY